MSTLVRRLLIQVVVLFFLGSLALAAPGQTSAKPPEKGTERSEEPEPEKGMKSRVFQIKYRDPRDLQPALSPLGSGSRWADMRANRDFSTITVRDFPENIAAIEDAISRLDRPEAPRPEVELKLWVLLASRAEGSAAPVPDDLKDVIASLKSTLTYRAYSPLGVFVQRVRDRAHGIQGGGSSEDGAGAAPIERITNLSYSISELTVDDPSQGAAAVRLDGFSFEASRPAGGSAKLRTDLSLKDGEKVVVGTSTLKDKGLVVVLTARVLR